MKKFVFVGKMKGGCCDYGWGDRGNTKIVEVEADTFEDALKDVTSEEHEEHLCDLMDPDGDWKPQSLTAYEVTGVHEVDLRPVHEAVLKERDAAWKKRQEEAERAELARLEARYR